MQNPENKIINGYRLNYNEAVELANNTPLEELCSLADRLRHHFFDNRFDTCSIMNARSGRCSENCKWCSQSKFHNTSVDIYPLAGVDESVELARYNANKGVKRFSLVTSGRSMTDQDVDQVCQMYSAIDKQVDIGLCASLGLLNFDQMKRLAKAGVTRYHCNLETAPSYFLTLCTTHTTAEKLKTLKNASDAGLTICSGGIIGMGESREQRIELAIALQQAKVDSIPLNILNPIPGTPLEATEPLSDQEIMLTVAMFRIINPDVHLRLAGGRTIVNHLQKQLLHCGISAAIVGDMLTTTGSNIDSDKAMVLSEGFLLE